MMEQAIYAFCIDAAPISCAPHGGGHINHTFKVVTESGMEYILQRVNQYVFHDPKSLDGKRRRGDRLPEGAGG